MKGGTLYGATEVLSPYIVPKEKVKWIFLTAWCGSVYLIFMRLLKSSKHYRHLVSHSSKLQVNM
jgi:hypothetical protein